MEIEKVIPKKKKKSLFWIFPLAILVVIGEFQYSGLARFAPFTTCLVLWFGCNWAQLSEGFEVLSKFEKITIPIFIGGLLLLVGLLVEELLMSKGPATLTSLFELLTTKGGKGVTGYEIALSLLGATTWTLTSVLLKNNKTEVAIFFVVFFALHMWGAQQGETPVYEGSFLSHIWEATPTDTLVNPNTPGTAPKIRKEHEETAKLVKWLVLFTILGFIARFFYKNLKKTDRGIIGKPVGFLILFLGLVFLFGVIGKNEKWGNLFSDIFGKWYPVFLAVIFSAIFAGIFFEIIQNKNHALESKKEE